MEESVILIKITMMMVAMIKLARRRSTFFHISGQAAH